MSAQNKVALSKGQKRAQNGAGKSEKNDPVVSDEAVSDEGSGVSSEEEDGQESVEEAEDEEDEEDEENFPLKKKAKKSKHDDGSAEFSNAVNAILSSHLKAYDRKDPIMARNKKVLRQNDAEKLEQQAKRALLVEKKKQLNKARKKEIIPSVTDDKSGVEIRNALEKETRLRKIARKGVVKLFNAILSTQVGTAKEAETNLGGIKNASEREQLITEVSKEKFLDMVKAAAEEE